MAYKVYRIGEAAKILDVKTSVLRFWESEFKQIRPKRTETGQRYYSEKDMQTLQKIHSLLYDQGMTIIGAKKTLQQLNKIENTTPIESELPELKQPNKPIETITENSSELYDTLFEIYNELKELHSLLHSTKQNNE